MTSGKTDVLLATGEVTVEHDNEHRSFRHHMSMLTTLLEATGHFRVRVPEEFRGIGEELLDRFDVVLVVHEGRDDHHSPAERLGDLGEPLPGLQRHHDVVLDHDRHRPVVGGVLVDAEAEALLERPGPRQVTDRQAQEEHPAGHRASSANVSATQSAMDVLT